MPSGFLADVHPLFLVHNIAVLHVREVQLVGARTVCMEHHIPILQELPSEGFPNQFSELDLGLEIWS